LRRSANTASAYHPDVRLVTGRKQQGPRQTDKGGQRLFEIVVRLAVAQNKMRRAGADAKTLCTLARRLDQRRVGRKAKIIVAAKRNIVAAIYADARSLRRFQQPPSPPQTSPLELQ